MSGPEGGAVTTSLHGVERSLALFYRALCGRGCVFVPYDDDAETRQRPDTGTTVRLPAHRHVPATLGADWYRVAVAHRAMHHEHATFALDLARAEPFFRMMRPVETAADDDRPGLERFFALFSRPALAVEVFVALEDLRVDAAAMRILPGLGPAFEQVRALELDARPDPARLPPRSAVAESLVRLSLGARAVDVAGSLREPVRLLAAVAGPLSSPRATVETTAEAAIRAFSVLAHLPNLGRAPGAIRTVDLSADAALREHHGFALHAEELRLEGDEVFDVRLAPVRYRDVPGPRYAGQAASGTPMREAILRTTTDDLAPVSVEQVSVERSQAAESGLVDVTTRARAGAPPEPLPHDHGPSLTGHHHPAEGAVHPARRGEFAYPEWDRVASAYLPAWCLVRESRPTSATGERTYRAALTRHRHLLPALTAQLERMSASGARRVLRMPYGDDLDLDACIEAMVDLRTAIAPGERIHSALVRDEREVAVAFALDLSSSTAQRLPEDTARRGQVRRILDVEREAVVLLMEALERVGDSYGIYGFSGTGRADVQVRVVKGLEERRSPAVVHRLEGLRPHHTTRMGLVIRHLARRLHEHEAPTKLLLVVSDGRPFDLDYGQRYGEDAVFDYALADTARALDEAREGGVRPYLITVDAAGDDYLRTMCDARDYHVIADVRELPESLATLYLAARAEGPGRLRSLTL